MSTRSEISMSESSADNVNNAENAFSGRTLYRLCLFSLVVAALYLADDVLIPVSVAILLGLLLQPIVRRLEEWRLPHSVAVVTTVALAFLLIGAVIVLAGQQIFRLAEEIPQYEQTFQTRITSLREHSPSGIARAVDVLQDIGDETFFPPSEVASAETDEGEDGIAIPVEIHDHQPTLMDMIQKYVTPALAPLARVGVVVVLVLFTLLYYRDLRGRLVMLTGRGNARLTERALNEAANRVSGYLQMQFVNNVCYGLLVGLGLWLIGLPGAIFWGVAAMLVRFIPYVGPWVGACLPILLSLGVFGDWLRPALVVGMFIGLEIAFNNFVEPYLFGAGAGISPLGVILALLFWGWVWGGIGLLFAVPLTACLVVAGRYLPQLQMFSVLLGSENGHDAAPSVITPSETTPSRPSALQISNKEPTA